MLDLDIEKIAIKTWVRSTEDFYPETPLADPGCGQCGGHGVLDAGDLMFMPDNCTCVMNVIATNYFGHGYGI